MDLYIAAALWGATILIAMVGWGGLACRALRVSAELDWAQRAATGFALSAVLGGLLDLFALASRTLIVGYIVAGACEFAYRIRHRPFLPLRKRTLAHRYGLVTLPVFALIAVVLCIRVGGSVMVVSPSGTPGSFNVWDDFQAYMVFPMKMVETGSMGADPFTIRRTPSHAYGGGTFLQALVVSALPAQSLRVLDVGLGTLVVVGLLWTLSGCLDVDRAVTAFCILVFLAVPPPLINITSLIVPTALFLSLFLLFEQPSDRMPAISSAVLIGTHTAAIGVLKTNLIPAAAAFVGLRACLVVLRASDKPRAVGRVMGWFAVVGVAALPWMLDAYRWTGTPLPRRLAAFYADPIRVAAFEQVTGFGTLLGHLRDINAVPYLVLGLLTALLIATWPERAKLDAVLSLVATAVVGSVAITLAVGGAVNNIDRFMYPFVTAALLVAFAYLIAAAPRARKRSSRAVIYFSIVGSAAALIVPKARLTARMYEFSVHNAADAIRGRSLVSTALAAKYRAMQSTLQPSAAVLARMDYPFLFDFGRNEVLINDMPGSASLPPGMPFFQGGQAVATYLLSHHIRYIAYDYGTQVRTPKDGPLRALLNDDEHPSARAVVRLTFNMHDNLMELARLYRHVYDDGTAFVLDLQAPSG